MSGTDENKGALPRLCKRFFFFHVHVEKEVEMRSLKGFILAELLIALVILSSVSLFFANFMLAKRELQHLDVLAIEMSTIQQGVISWLTTDIVCQEQSFIVSLFRNSTFALEYPRRPVLKQLVGIDVSQLMVKFTWQFNDSKGISALSARVPNSAVTGKQIEVLHVLSNFNCGAN